MKRSEVTADKLRGIGYKAMRAITTWNTNHEEECNEKQSAELFELVAKTAREGGKVEIRRNHVRGTVIAHVDGTYHSYRGTEIYYFLQRPMSAAEIFEGCVSSGFWVHH